jgi:hypothetical protein
MQRHFRGVTPAVFPAKAGPTFVFTANLTDCTHCCGRTGFSREEVLCMRRMQRHVRGVTPAVFPAKAGPTFVFTANLTDCTHCCGRTGFSREEVLVRADNFAV